MFENRLCVSSTRERRRKQGDVTLIGQSLGLGSQME